MKRKVLLQMLISGILLLSTITNSNAQQKLIHYWHFNNFTLTSSTNVNPSTIVPLKADYSSLDTSKAFIAYRAFTGTSSSYLSYWDNTSGDTSNARLGFPAGNGLRPRNPWDSMQLMLFIPTTKYQNITIKYGTQRSGSGPTTQTFDYSLDSGNTYITTGLSVPSFTVTSTANPMNLNTVTISNAATFNNSNLIFRIRFGPAPGAGNNRFDNVTVEGDTLISGPVGPPLFNIGQINTTNPTSGVADSINGHYTLRGLVYGFNQRSPSAGTQFLLKDNTGGVTVFNVSKTFGYIVTEGDSLEVPGIVQTYRGFIEFAPDTIIKIASGKTIKSPTPITQLVEANENDLVKMNNLIFYTVPTGGNWPIASTNILCHTQNLTDTIIVRVLAGSALSGTALPTASLFNITGMVQQFSTSSSAPYAFNGYEILPRTSADILSGLAPPDAVSSIVGIPNLTSLTLSWTKPATYNNTTMATLVFIKSGSAITQGTPNKNANFYTANAVFGTGTAFQNDANAKCVLNSTNNTIVITGLSQSTNYYAVIYNVRLADSAYSIAAISNLTTTNNLPNPVTALTVNGVTPTSATISWTKPAGYDNTAHSTIVFVKASSSITAGTPNKGVSAYVANTSFGSGTTYQNDASAFCVYNGDSGFVTVSNLIQGTNYNVMVWVVRNADSTYATLSTTGNGTALPPPPSVKLIHYWNFNNLANTYSASSIANSFKNVGITADFSILDTAKAKIFYRTFDGVSDTYLTYFDNVGGDTMNARMNAPAGLGYRARNPSDSMQLMFYIPTQHYKNIKVSYACEKSSIASGAYQQNFDYSIDAGKNWKTSGLNITFDSTIGIAYTPVYLSFPNDTLTGNNPNLILRVKFVAGPIGIGSPTGLSGNNRFDNVAVEGDTTTATPQPVIKTGISQVTKSNSDYVMFPNPSNGELFINSKTTDTKHIVIMNITGQIVVEYFDNLKEIKMDISNLTQGIYFVRVTENSSVSTMKLIKN
ncbi:MAG: T9SS type A sorting domain-containing protein [Bacteroidota bacterium]